MKFNFFIKILFFFIASIFIISCSKNEIIPENVEVNDFVWGGMNAYYKWQGNVDDLADTKFSTRNELNEYLDNFDSPEALFNSLLYQDDASIISNDYNTLEDAQNGIIFTTGLQIEGAVFDDGSGYYAQVYNVIEGSNAAGLGITAGTVYTQVNGTTITAANISTLFSAENLTLIEADYNNGNPVANGNVYTISASEVEENPIKATSIINIANQNIGYLAYQHFGENYVDELNAVFSEFNTNNIDDLIIDLRYNSGTGSTQMAMYLGSMITGQFTDEVFSKQIWNEKVMSNIHNSNLTTYFSDEIDDSSERINSLELSTVYFIVSNQTSSAALLLINSLQPYINVQLIGEQTDNNFFVSTILYDSDDYTKEGDNFNTSHTWAIQPVVFEVQNKDNSNNSVGFTPNVAISVDPNSASILGDLTEPLLARTLEYITTGAKSINGTTNTENTSTSTSSKNNSTMYFSF